MTDFPSKFDLLKKLLVLMGTNGIEDYVTRVFNADLKNETFCKQASELLSEQVTADIAVKRVKELLDHCKINYTCGRTSRSTYFQLTDKIVQEDDFLWRILPGGLLYKFNNDEYNLPLTLLCASSNSEFTGRLYSWNCSYMKANKDGSCNGRMEMISSADYNDHIGVILSGDIEFAVNFIKSIRRGPVEYRFVKSVLMTDGSMILHWIPVESNSSEICFDAFKSVQIEYDPFLVDKFKWTSVISRNVYFDHEYRKNGKWIKQDNIYADLSEQTEITATDSVNLSAFNFIRSIHFKQLPLRIVMNINGRCMTLTKQFIEFMKDGPDQTDEYALSLNFYKENLGGLQALMSCGIDRLYISAIDEYGDPMSIIVKSFDSAVASSWTLNVQRVIKEKFPSAKFIEFDDSHKYDPLSLRCDRLFYVTQAANSGSVVHLHNLEAKTSDLVSVSTDCIDGELKVSRGFWFHEIDLHREIVCLFPFIADMNSKSLFFYLID